MVKMDEFISKHEAYKMLKDKQAAYMQVAVNEAFGTAALMIDQMEAADVQPVRHGKWIIKAEDYYKAWQDSGRSWDDMPYFITGLRFACSNCFEQYNTDTEGVEKWNGCPCCLARMDGEQNGD
jgi:hypothetical protein